MTQSTSSLFQRPKPIIGTLQLLALPGSPQWNGHIQEVIARAEQEATALATGGIDALVIENTGDTPYTADRIDPAGAIALGLITRRIMHFTQLPIGISVLRNDPETALAIAMNVGAKFIRVSLLSGAAVSDEGVLEGKFRALTAYKKQLQCEHIKVWADIGTQQLQPLGSSKSLEDMAKEAMRSGADSIVLTDPGLQPDVIQSLAEKIDIPVYHEFQGPLLQAKPYIESASGLIVASSVKKSFMVSSDAPPTVDLTKVEELNAMAEQVRSGEHSLV